MILPFQGIRPKIDPTVFIADNALVIGDVELGAKANIWFFCLVRGDVQPIRIGAGCNIQDACILHVGRKGFPLVLEDHVVLGHRVTAHGCHIERGAFIGMGATILNGSRIGEEAIVGAGSLVTPGTIIPPRSMALGTPAKVVRELTEKDFAMMRGTCNNYLNLMEIYKDIPLAT
jgi:carbonic anhydrase/acetyltransferase-like protein (isoleucine patch superfamily)